MKWLHKVHDFRLLPLLVVLSMAAGMGMGKIFGISQYQLTPPIDAIKALLQGTYEFSVGNSLALGVVACAFNSTGRDFEIAIAIAITAFSPMVALATVVGPLIEVPIMLTLVWLARRTENRLFGARAQAT